MVNSILTSKFDLTDQTEAFKFIFRLYNFFDWSRTDLRNMFRPDFLHVLSFVGKMSDIPASNTGGDNSSRSKKAGTSKNSTYGSIAWNMLCTMLTTRFRKNDQTFFVSSTTHRRHLKLNMIIVLLTIYLIVFLPHLLLKPFKRQQTFKSDHMFSHFCHTFVTQTGASERAEKQLVVFRFGHVLVTLRSTQGKISPCSSIIPDKLL